jgi:hypothetical protein
VTPSHGRAAENGSRNLLIPGGSWSLVLIGVSVNRQVGSGFLGCYVGSCWSQIGEAELKLR